MDYGFCFELFILSHLQFFFKFNGIDQHPENAAEIKLTMAQLKISQGINDDFIMIKISF